MARPALVAVALLALCPIAGAADWPMWRADARHSGASEAELPESLHLQWTRELQATMAAWPNEPRLHFDAAYAPVVAGGLLLVSSPNEGSLTAYAAATGQERWKYFADGPIRFAPAVCREKVFVGADDGWLHVVGLADGRPLGKVRGAPADRPDYRHLGNNRLVSFWPVRGGPVVADDTVYFAAGIWPTQGISILAVDAESLAIRWRNDGLGYIDQVRFDHNALGHSGLSPQGYLAVDGDLLVVPNGRSMPAGLDRRSGKLLWYCQGYRNGECKVVLAGRYAFVGRSGVVDLRSGREVGSRWAAAGANAPKAFDGKKFHLFEGPFHPYKQFAGCSARSVADAAWAYDFEAGLLTARDLDRVVISEWESKSQFGVVKPWRWDPPLAWSLKTNLTVKKQADAALLRAGRRLYGHAAGKLIAARLADDASQPPRIVWQQDLPGTPAELAAADGRLFVVTREGQISCFGPEQGETKRYRLAPPPPFPLPHGEREVAREGHGVLLGLGSGRLLEDLLAQSKLKLIAVDADREKVDRCRRRLIAAGLYPQRAELVVGEPLEFLFPPYLANLITGEETFALPSDDASAARLLDAVHPYGGALDLPMSDDTFQALSKKAAAARDRYEARFEGGRGVFRRVGAPAGSTDWTHESADPERTYFSRDSLVRPPLAVLWYGDGNDHGFWKEKDYGTGVKPQVVGGRVFALRITSNTLFAYDAYTGELLWQNKVSPFTRYASLADGIYVAGNGHLVVYDPATGRRRADWPFEIEPGRPALVSDIRVDDRLVLVAADLEKSGAIAKGLWDSRALIALDRQSGCLLWKWRAKDRFNNHSIALGHGLVFCVDSRSPMETKKGQRRGEPAATAPSTVLALDAATGQVRWSKVVVNPYRTYDADRWLSARANDDWTAYCQELDLVVAGKMGTARAYEAATGRQVWEQKVGGQPLILRGPTFLSQAGESFDMRSGKSLGARARFARGGCNYAVACRNLLLVRNRSVSYIDLQTGAKQDLYAIRSGCSNSLVAADGLLNVPNFAVQCVCNYPIQTSFAMLHMPAAAAWLPAK